MNTNASGYEVHIQPKTRDFVLLQIFEAFLQEFCCNLNNLKELLTTYQILKEHNTFSMSSSAGIP